MRNYETRRGDIKNYDKIKEQTNVKKWNRRFIKI